MIEPLRELTDDDARRLIVGFETNEVYRFTKSETRERTELVFELVEKPFEKRFPLPAMMIGYYRGVLSGGLCFKAVEDDAFVGITIAALALVPKMPRATSELASRLGRRS